MARFIPAALVLLTLPAFGQQEKPPRILFSFDATPATKIIEVIAKISGSNIVVSPNLEGSITMRLQNVPWREALTRVVDAVDGGIIEEGRVIRVLSAKEMAEAVTRTFELQHVEASEATLAVWSEMLTEEGSLEYFPEKHTIVVRDELRKVLAVGEIIRRVDRDVAAMVTDLQELMADLQAMRQSSVAVDADLLARIQQIVADMQAAIAGLPAASKR